MRAALWAILTRCAPAALAVVMVTVTSPASATCLMSYCQDKATSTPAPSTSWAITNTSRQRLGDVYNPGHGRRLQLRNNDRFEPLTIRRTDGDRDSCAHAADSHNPTKMGIQIGTLPFRSIH